MATTLMGPFARSLDLAESLSRKIEDQQGPEWYGRSLWENRLLSAQWLAGLRACGFVPEDLFDKETMSLGFWMLSYLGTHPPADLVGEIDGRVARGEAAEAVVKGIEIVKRLLAASAAPVN